MKFNRTMGAFALAWLFLLTHCGSAQTPRSTTNASPAMQLSSGRTASSSTNATHASLPETPSRVAIVEAMQAITPAVQTCGRIEHGQARVQFNFDGPTGSLISAVVMDAGAGTPLAACIEDAVRGARVPPFRRPTFLVNYPFRL